MKKVFGTVMLILVGQLSFAQNDMPIDQPFFGLPSYPTETTEINSLGQLPTKIQFIVREVMKTSMTDFASSIKFVKGQVIDLDNWLTNDSTTQTDYLRAVPRYQLYFELSDMRLNIKTYCFELSLDSYGQLLALDWPRADYGKIIDFANSKSVKTEATNFATDKGYKTESLISELKYDTELNKMCWQISFLQKSTGDNFKYRTEYKTLVVDAISLTVLKELDMFAVGID
ncbi:MAG: hypothetical protein QM762_13695 [Chryseolinea sp.]